MSANTTAEEQALADAIHAAIYRKPDPVLYGKDSEFFGTPSHVCSRLESDRRFWICSPLYQHISPWQHTWNVVDDFGNLVQVPS
jgi:hypothetical protein